MGSSDEEEPVNHMDEQDPRPAEQGPEPAAVHPLEPTPEPRSQPVGHENLARHGAPVPPPADLVPHLSATPPVPPRRRGPRLLAVGTALAVVTAAGGVGF